MGVASHRSFRGGIGWLGKKTHGEHGEKMDIHTWYLCYLLNYDDNGRMEDHLLLIGEILNIFKLLIFHCHLSVQGFIPDFIHLCTPPKATRALNRGYFKGKVLLQTPFFRGRVSFFFGGGHHFIYVHIYNT